MHMVSSVTSSGLSSIGLSSLEVGRKLCKLKWYHIHTTATNPYFFPVVIVPVLVFPSS